MDRINQDAKSADAEISTKKEIEGGKKKKKLKGKKKLELGNV